MNVFFSTIIIGFGFSMIVASVFRLFISKPSVNTFIDDCMGIAMVLIRWVGLAYIAFGLFMYTIHPESSVVARATGPYAWAFWMMLLGITVLPQLYWIKRMRNAPYRFLVAIGLLITSGAFFEELVILITSLHRDYTHSEVVFGFLLKNCIRMFLFVTIVVIIRDFKMRINSPK